MTVDCYILWSISDPKLFYQTLGSTAVAEQRLDALTCNELKTVILDGNSEPARILMGAN